MGWACYQPEDMLASPNLTGTANCCAVLQRIEFFDRHRPAEITTLLTKHLDSIRTFVFGNVTRDRGARSFLEAVGSGEPAAGILAGPPLMMLAAWLLFVGSMNVPGRGARVCHTFLYVQRASYLAVQYSCSFTCPGAWDPSLRRSSSRRRPLLSSTASRPR